MNSGHVKKSKPPKPRLEMSKDTGIPLLNYVYIYIQNFNTATSCVGNRLTTESRSAVGIGRARLRHRQVNLPPPPMGVAASTTARIASSSRVNPSPRPHHPAALRRTSAHTCTRARPTPTRTSIPDPATSLTSHEDFQRRVLLAVPLLIDHSTPTAHFGSQALASLPVVWPACMHRCSPQAPAGVFTSSHPLWTARSRRRTDVDARRHDTPRPGSA